MQTEARKAAVQPTPLLLQAVYKVEQVVARLQELQNSITGSHLMTPSKFNSPSCRMPGLLGYSPNKSTAMECRVSGEFRKLSPWSKGSMAASKEERRKSLTIADGWRHWSSPAKDVHNVISEIMLASQFAKQFVNIVGSKPFQKPQYISSNSPKSMLTPAKKFSTDTNPDTDTSPKKAPRLNLAASADFTLAAGDDSQIAALEPTVCSSVESLEETPVRTSRVTQLNRRSSSKKYSTKKPPPHVFKVVVATEGPAAKVGSAISLRQIEARKMEARRLTTPSPLYKRKSGTLVPPSALSDLRSSSTSQSSIMRSSLEKKPRLQNSASVQRSTEKFVEACRALMEEEAQLNRSSGQAVDGSVKLSSSPPLVIKPLSLESPASAVRVKAPVRKNKNWLTHRFLKTSVRSSAEEIPIIKPRKKASTAKNLPTLISRLPVQKLDSQAVPSSTVRSKTLDPPASTSSSGVLEPLPLPPARQADNVMRSTAGMAMKASKDKKSGVTSYALVPLSMPRGSRELSAVDSNSVREKEKAKCSVGCPAKDLSAQSKGKNNYDVGTEASVPSYMRAKAGGGSGKENNVKLDNASRRSSVGLDQNPTAAKRSSGTSFLHRAKDWVSLHKTKDKGRRKIPETSQKVAVAG